MTNIETVTINTMRTHEKEHLAKIFNWTVLFMVILSTCASSFAQQKTKPENWPEKIIFEVETLGGEKVNSYYQFLMTDIGRFMIDTCLLTSGTFELFITDSKVDSVIYKGYLPDTLVRMVRENIQKSSGLWHLNRLEAGKQFKVIQQITLNYTVLNNCGYTIETIGAATSWSTLNLIDMLLYEENYAQAGNRIFIYPVLLDNYVKR